MTFHEGALVDDKFRGFKVEKPEKRKSYADNLVLNALKSVAGYVNELPFSGKLAITPLVTEAYKENNPDYKTVRAAEAAAFLLVMIYCHFIQAESGQEMLKNQMEILKYHTTPEGLVKSSIDAAYMVANYAVVYAQTFL